MALQKMRTQAEAWFNCGNVEECVGLLESVLSGSASFSRVQWQTSANILACKMKIALQNNDIDRLVSIQKLYRSLWEQITGLPMTTESFLTEMIVTLALCQLEHILLSSGRLMSLCAVSRVNSHCQRLCEHSGTEWQGLPQSLPSLTKILDNQKAVLLLKTVYLTAVLQMRSTHTLAEGLSLMATLQSVLSIGEEYSGIELALKIKEQLNADSGDLEYLRAWRHYGEGDYPGSLSVLTSSPPTPVASLLQGYCYANMSKPHTAQCWYLTCLASKDEVTSLTAMASCCLLYRQTSNCEAELKARELRLEALQCKRQWDSVGVLWWRETGVTCLCNNPVQQSETEWAESAYVTAMRAIHYKKFEMAANVLQQLLECGYLPSPFPAPSTLHLLLAKTLFQAGDHQQAWTVCEKLADHLSILELEECTAHSVLTLSQSLFMGALSLAEMGDTERAKCFSHKSYKVCGFLISRLCRDTDTGSDTLNERTTLLMELNLTLLAGLSVGTGERSNALSLLTQAVALSPTPLTITVYNYCLLLTQLGKLREATNYWLRRRGQLPSNKQEARRMIEDRKSTIPEKDYQCLDVAMLKMWIRQN